METIKAMAIVEAMLTHDIEATLRCANAAARTGDKVEYVDLCQHVATLTQVRSTVRKIAHKSVMVDLVVGG
jgi:hypothetical protein